MGAKSIKRFNMKFIEISSDEQKEILGYVQENTGLKSAIIEKDWWVTAVLRAIFMLPYSKHISFKGPHPRESGLLRWNRLPSGG